MIDLKNIDKWVMLEPDEGYVFAKQHPRTVTLHVRSAQKVSLYVTSEEGETVFLCNVDGYEKVKFRLPSGKWTLTGDGSQEVYFYTIEFEKAAVEIPNAVIFTKIAERKARNPELEKMMQLMQVNMERRLQQQSLESNARTKAAVAAALKEAKGSAHVDDTAKVDGKSDTESEDVKSSGDGDGKPKSEDKSEAADKVAEGADK